MSDTPSAAPQEPQLQGSLYLFRKPELLSREKHLGLGVTYPEKPFGFCANIRAIPLVVTEISAAQRHYPIIFSNDETPHPMAVVGLIDDVNLFVDENGKWEPGCYVPGYIRRYPFALAGDQQSDRMAMVVDSEYEGVNNDPQVPFFNGEELSSETKQAMEFCTNYERDRQMTTNFAQQLGQLGILANQLAQFTPEGESEPKPFAQYTGIDEKKLGELSEDKFLELRKSNMLPLLYAQLMSMGNWRLLMDRRVQRFNLTRDDLLKPVTKQ